MSKRIITLLLAFIMVFSFVACDQNTGTKEGEEKKETAAEKKETKAEDKKAENGKPETWIADREINLLVFQSADDAGEDSMSDDIKKYIKDRTGITLNIQSVSNEDSKEALAAGLASGDLPDAVAFYLNNSGRPEFPLLLKASNEGMFHDIAPFLKESKTYSKYFE